jgi:hypothetical protein
MDAQDREALATGLREIDAYARHQFSEVQEATKLDDQQTRARAFQAFADSLVSLQFMRALANVELNVLAAQIPQLPSIIGEREWNKLKEPLEAWVALRAGDLERCREIVEKVGTGNSIMRVCKAELLAAEGNNRDAAAEYDLIMRVDPFIPYGAWARSRSMELTGRTDPVTEAGRLMQRLVREVPTSIDTLTRDPSAVMSLTIEAAEPIFGSADRSRLRVEVTNLTPFPLSLGPNRTISSRILLGVSVDDPGQFLSPPQPVVVDLDRRFRLMPGEKLGADVEVERGINGLIFGASNRGVIRQRWQGWQDPQVDMIGGYRPGPYSLSDSTNKFQRTTRDTSRLAPAAIADLVASAGNADEAVRAIECAASRLWRDGPADGAIVAALVDRYERGDALERLLMVSCLPGEAQSPGMEAFDAVARETLANEAVRAVESPRALAAMVLLTRVRDAGDPLLAAAAGSGDRVLASAARLLGGRLASDRPAYATTGPGLGALEGASKVNAIRGDGSP